MSELWYADGLRFECTRCGNCCTSFPGFVWLNDEEITTIAEFLGETLEVFLSVWTRTLNHKRSLREKANYDCVFYAPGMGCTIYSVRPRQCRTWPFWESNLASPEAWERTRHSCPGAGEGELIPVEEIVRRVRTIKL